MTTHATPISVTELTSAIKGHLETRFTSLCVQGEITNLTKQHSGHIYFNLKDEKSQISAVLFKGSASKLTRLPKSGDQVILRGEISVYAPRGTYQIIVRTLEFAGVGDLLLKLHQRKEKLAAKGYFDPEIKKPIPTFPKRIGVVTSPTGAVIQDIIHVLTRRMGRFHLTLIPVKVQGEGAEKEIAEAIDLFNTHRLADVIIVGRGGGSLEDLLPFSEECVADAIFRSKIPIISAVGHETDYSIADYTADLRAPTPSAAAEILSQELATIQKNLEGARQFIRSHLQKQISYYHSKLDRFKTHPLFQSSEMLLAPYVQKLDEMTVRLNHVVINQFQRRRIAVDAMQRQLSSLNPTLQLQAARKHLTSLQEQIEISFKNIVHFKRSLLTGMQSHLLSIHPKQILKKGFCIPMDQKGGSVYKSVKNIQEGNPLHLLFHDGEIDTTITKIQSYDQQTT